MNTLKNEITLLDLYALASVMSMPEHPETGYHDCCKIAQWAFEQAEKLVAERNKRLER